MPHTLTLRYLFCALSLATAGWLQAQTSVTLTFTASYNGNHKPLDSILVQNLTQGGDTMLYGTDTILVLDQNTGIREPWTSGPVGFALPPNEPNPFSGTTRFRIHLYEFEMITLRVFDLAGREHARFVRELHPGTHLFTFTAGTETHYVLSAETPKQRLVRKMIQIGSGTGVCRIDYTGWQEGGPDARMAGKSGFPWQQGDALRFTGFTTLMPNYPAHQILHDDPVVSASYAFSLINGLPCLEEPFVTDVDGNVYRTVQIGSQCWFRDNLKATRYTDGTPIPVINANATWNQLFSLGAMCWYNNDSATYAGLYGALYNRHALRGLEPATLCPAGWHVPSDAEWMILTAVLGGDNSAGGRIKEQGTTHWTYPNTGATNQSGFSALPGGTRLFTGNFAGVSGYALFWTTTDFFQFHTWTRAAEYDTGELTYGNSDQVGGNSVRCIRNQ